jgi:hypothetical protein
MSEKIPGRHNPRHGAQVPDMRPLPRMNAPTIGHELSAEVVIPGYRKCGHCGRLRSVRNRMGTSADDSRAMFCKPDCASPRELREIADEILLDWLAPYFGARPYIEAMRHLDAITSTYGAESGERVVRGFLVNAATWRGETARQVKAELKRMASGRELVALSCGHTRELPAAAAAQARRNGDLFCPKCGHPSNVKGAVK